MPPDEKMERKIHLLLNPRVYYRRYYIKRDFIRHTLSFIARLSKEIESRDDVGTEFKPNET